MAGKMDRFRNLVSLFLSSKPQPDPKVEHVSGGVVATRPQQQSGSISLEKLIIGEVRLEDVGEHAKLPVYVERGYLLHRVPHWEKAQLVTEANSENPITPEVMSQLEGLLKNTKAIANGNPTVNGAAYVHEKIIEARRLYNIGRVYKRKGVDFFHDPRFADDVKDAVGVNLKKAFERAKALAGVGDFNEMQRQLKAPLLMAYAFGSGPDVLTDYHEQLDGVFKKAGVTAKRLAILNLQEVNSTEQALSGQALKPVNQVVEMAKTYGVQLNIPVSIEFK